MGYSTTVTVISSRFFNTFCTGGCSPGLSGLLFHRCLYPAQGHPANLTLSPGTGQRPLKLSSAQTYRRTLSSRRSEGLGSIQPPLKDTTKAFPSRRHGSTPCTLSPDPVPPRSCSYSPFSISGCFPACSPPF